MTKDLKTENKVKLSPSDARTIWAYRRLKDYSHLVVDYSLFYKEHCKVHPIDLLLNYIKKAAEEKDEPICYFYESFVFQNLDYEEKKIKRSEEAMLIHSAVCTVVETTAIQKSINAYFKNAYTRAILNDVIGNVFERQQNEIEKALNSKSPLEELAEKVSESNEKTLTGLINDIMKKAKAAKDLIGEN